MQWICNRRGVACEKQKLVVLTTYVVSQPSPDMSCCVQYSVRTGAECNKEAQH